MQTITQADRDVANAFMRPCLDGVYHYDDLTEAFARHRMEERAAIVAWLRSDKIVLSMDGSAEDVVASAIEAGEHLT